MARNTLIAPEARKALDQLKFEMAKQIGLDYNQAYKGNIASKDNGAVGGHMVRHMIQAYEAGRVSTGIPTISAGLK